MEQAFSPVEVRVPTRTSDGSIEVPHALMREVPYFKGLDDADLSAVAELMRPMHLQPGDFVYRQGSPPDGVYVLETGRALMWTRFGDTRRDIIEYTPRSMLCLGSIVETGGRIASIEATAPSRVWVLDAKAFEGLLRQRHAVAMRTLWVSCEEGARAFPRSLGLMRQAAKIAASAPAPADAFPAARGTTPADETLLRALPFARSLSPQDAQTLCRVARWHDVKRGHRLLTEGGPRSPMLLVVRGALEVLLEPPEGKLRLSVRGPGGWVGHESCAGGGSQPCSVVARENSVLLGIEQADLLELYEARDGLAIALLQQVCAAVTEQFNRDLVPLLRTAADHSAAVVSSDQLKAMHHR